MLPFATYVLRNYYKNTGWNEDNLFSNFTRSSQAILDFSVPKGLQLNLSKAPNSLFNTTYSLNFLQPLNGSLGYIFTSCPLDLKGSENVRFKNLVDRFRVYDKPQRPVGKEEEWLAGERVSKRDYLLYGRLYIPTGRLDALYSTRLSPTLQAQIAAISDRRSTPAPNSRNRPGELQDNSNVMLSLQHDTGRWCTEYSWSADDGMWGARVLHNFGRLAGEADRERRREKGVDEEEAMEGGLKGRFSAGAEVYFSAKEKSAGVSTGLRFTTVPDATPPSAQLPGTPQPVTSQPPTTITAIFNPMMGHWSGAYAAQVSRNLALCTRFDFNMYSYESEWAVGAEWWIRREASNLDTEMTESPIPTPPPNPPPASQPVESPLFKNEVRSVVKAKASTNSDISLMWEGRIRNVLVSLGVVSGLTDRGGPIRAIGLEMAYFATPDSS